MSEQGEERTQTMADTEAAADMDAFSESTGAINSISGAGGAGTFGMGDDPKPEADTDDVVEEAVEEVDEQPTRTSFDIPQEQLRTLLNNDIPLAEIVDMSDSLREQLVTRFAAKAEEAASPAADDDTEEILSALDPEERKAVERLIEQRLGSIQSQAANAAQVAEQQAVAAQREALAAKYPDVKTDAGWERVMARATEMANEVGLGKRTPFNGYGDLFSAASGDVFAEQVAASAAAQSERVARAKAKSAPTPTRKSSTGAAKSRSIEDVEDAALREIVGKGNLDVRSIRGKIGL